MMAGLRLSNTAFLAAASGGTPAAFLVTYPGAIAAYSLRDLTGTNPDVIRARRSSDNTEQNFKAPDITGGALATFCGAGDGLVVSWFDQSGNARTVTQATAANQPTIASAGVVVMVNGRHAIDWGATQNGKSLSLTGLSIQHGSSFVVAIYDGSDPFTNYRGLLTLSGGVQNDLPWITSAFGTDWYDPATPRFMNSSTVSSANALPTAQSQFLGYSNILSNAAQTAIHIGRDRVNANRGWLGKIQEIIIYPDNQSATQLAQRAAINTHYSIY